MKRNQIALLVIASLFVGSLLTTLIFLNSNPLAVVVHNVLGVDEPYRVAENGNGKSGLWATESREGDKNSPELDRFLEAYEIITKSFYDKEAVNSKDLIEGAINGMIGVLEDPYTTYMDDQESKMFNESLGSSFEGIGTEVMMLNNRVTIISPFKDSPAEKAGLKPNDQIISVDDESIEGLNLNEAVQKIRGPKGTKVKLEIMRDGVSEPLVIIVIRDTIPIETVYAESYTVSGKKLGKIEISSFSQNTAERFAEEFKKLKNDGVEGIVIDVRGNPGGLLDSVLKISEMVIPNRGTIVQIEDRDGKRAEYKSTLRDDGFPIVVLIDEGSASASEILAGALKDSGYPVVGKPSFGKGTVQVPKTLQNGGSLKITISKWLTPDGTWIHKKGVLPTREVSQPDYFRAAMIHVEDSLQLDMNNLQVQNLQLILKGLNFDPGRQDGYFDKGTEKAVSSFQKSVKLPTTGVVDQETAQKLEDALIQQIRDPKNDVQLQEGLQELVKFLKSKK